MLFIPLDNLKCIWANCSCMHAWFTNVLQCTCAYQMFCWVRSLHARCLWNKNSLCYIFRIALKLDLLVEIKTLQSIFLLNKCYWKSVSTQNTCLLVAVITSIMSWFSFCLSSFDAPIKQCIDKTHVWKIVRPYHTSEHSTVLFSWILTVWFVWGHPLSRLWTFPSSGAC